MLLETTARVLRRRRPCPSPQQRRMLAPMARRSAAAPRDSADVSEPPSADRPSDRFLAGLEHASRVTFVSHVHPDPDSLGSMMGLAHLVETCLGKPTRLTRDGPVSRAENRAMVELLGLELLKVEDATWD